MLPLVAGLDPDLHGVEGMADQGTADATDAPAER